MVEKQRTAKCPICSEPADAHYRPFCSRRCADIDLHRWFSGGYVIAGRDGDEPDSDSQEQSGAAAEGADDDAGGGASGSAGRKRKSKPD